MTPQQSDAFFTVHRDIPREGPGTPEEVYWVLEQTGLGQDVDVLDAACGPGADLVTLAEALPHARITGIEQVAHFVTAAAVRAAQFGPRVTVREGDMAVLDASYDLIWCAGALYFLGVTEGLRGWHSALKPGGKIAFSEPVLLSSPAPGEVAAFWEDYPQITDLEGIRARVTAAGYRTLGHRMIVGAPWAAYYDPMQARIDMLLVTASDPVLIEALDDAQLEIDRWRAAPDQIAYASLLVEPA